MVDIREALGSLVAAKQRTLLALLGVIIGVGSVMAMLTLGETVKTAALMRFKAMGTDILTILPSSSGLEAPGKAEALSLADYQRLARYAHTVKLVSPEINGWGKVSAGRHEVNASLKAVRPDYQAVNRLTARRGRFLSFLDAGRPHVVLGAGVLEDLVAAGAPHEVGQVRLEGLPFDVVGVLNPAGLGMRSNEVDKAVFIPLESAGLIWSRPVIGQATVKLVNDEVHEAAASEIRQVLARIAGRPVPLMIHSPRQVLEAMAEQMRLYTLLLAAVGSISLVVGGVGIMNMMLVSVTERRREIGLRRALGASQGDIAGQFLVESTVLALSGGLLGILLAVGVAWAAAWWQGWDLVVPWVAPVLCLAVAVLVGLFFGYYPARKAGRLEIITALRAA